MIDKEIDKTEKKKTTIKSIFRIPLTSPFNQYKVKKLLEKKLAHEKEMFSSTEQWHQESRIDMREI